MKYPYLIIIRKVKFVVAMRIECEAMIEEHNLMMEDQDRLDMVITEADLLFTSCFTQESESDIVKGTHSADSF
jgi:hypothetical protein